MRYFGFVMLMLLMVGAALPVGSAMAQDEETEFVWPRKLVGDRGEIIIYQPQIESFVGNRLEYRAAVSVKRAGEEQMVFGAVWFESVLATDMETRMATLERTAVTVTKFRDADQAKVDELSRYLEEEIPQWDLVISIDRLLASLPENQQGGASEGLKSEPPHIYHRTVPAVLVSIDGEPIFTDLEGFELQYVANSAFFIVREKDGGLFYLRGSGSWFTSDLIDGTWQPADSLPGEIAKVSKKIDEEEAAQAAEQAEDAEALGLEKSGDEPAPEIIVSTKPAELIVTDGEPDFASVEGTQLLYLKNTESDVVMDIASQKYFVLMAGRWYRGSGLAASDWEFVDFEDLPEEFAVVPPDSDLGNILTSVPGTTESREAILETQIPQTAEVDRKTATVEVTYDGDPQFESCTEGVAYALNTEKSVLLIDKMYYCVDSAVWFVSSGPEGPWEVATEVPAVVQELPPECPVYNVKYVYIYDSTPEVVYMGYTSGYYGSYVYGPCVVYGTGWYYDPWWGTYYYPRPVNWGYGVHYSPWTGWGFSFGVSYGWVSIGVGWGRPYYGGWGAGGYRYGYRRGYWHGYNRGYRHGYHHGARAGYRAGYRAGQHNNGNAYRNRKDGVRKTGDVRSGSGKRPSTTDRRNNVYADRNGDVYRDKDGSWEKREDGKWSEDRGDKDRDRDSKDGDRESKDRDRDNKERDRENQERDRQSKDRDREKSGERDQANRDRDKQQMDRGRDKQQMDRDRNSSRDRNQQLDRDKSSRNRGNERQRQSPNRGGSRGGAGRGGGGGRRR